MTKIYKEAPDSKLLPHMITDEEVPAFADDLALRESNQRLMDYQTSREASHPTGSRKNQLLATGTAILALAGAGEVAGQNTITGPAKRVQEIVVQANEPKGRKIPVHVVKMENAGGQKGGVEYVQQGNSEE